MKLGLKTLYRVFNNALFLRFKKNTKLNLGAGGTRMGDYTNVDSLFMKETDLLCELKNLSYFIKKESVTHIYASHILEHFSINEVKDILKKSYNLLQEEGEIRISVPDFEKIASLYMINKDSFRQKDPVAWLGVIYGGQSSRYDFHKTGFSFVWLKTLLTEAGFRDIKEYNAEDFLKNYNIKDSSLYKKDFGEYISLNVVAKK
ncbi:MAG: methyltransferase [Candidatus Pacebacteria bacterium]|nr:methyltransferase [Candidatus Paceibacterota bacterium]